MRSIDTSNNVQAVTTADIQKFAGTRLDAKTSNIIIVGNAKYVFAGVAEEVSEC